jgi:hypothetical protein
VAPHPPPASHPAVRGSVAVERRKSWEEAPRRLAGGHCCVGTERADLAEQIAFCLLAGEVQFIHPVALVKIGLISLRRRMGGGNAGSSWATWIFFLKKWGPALHGFFSFEVMWGPARSGSLDSVHSFYGSGWILWRSCCGQFAFTQLTCLGRSIVQTNLLRTTDAVLHGCIRFGKCS